MYKLIVSSGILMLVTVKEIKDIPKHSEHEHQEAHVIAQKLFNQSVYNFNYTQNNIQKDFKGEATIVTEMFKKY
jgi:hypothetical protein